MIRLLLIGLCLYRSHVMIGKRKQTSHVRIAALISNGELLWTLCRHRGSGCTGIHAHLVHVDISPCGTLQRTHVCAAETIAASLTPPERKLLRHISVHAVLGNLQLGPPPIPTPPWLRQRYQHPWAMIYGRLWQPPLLPDALVCDEHSLVRRGGNQRSRGDPPRFNADAGCWAAEASSRIVRSRNRYRWVSRASSDGWQGRVFLSPRDGDFVYQSFMLL